MEANATDRAKQRLLQAISPEDATRKKFDAELEVVLQNHEPHQDLPLLRQADKLSLMMMNHITPTDVLFKVKSTMKLLRNAKGIKHADHKLERRDSVLLNPDKGVKIRLSEYYDEKELLTTNRRMTKKERSSLMTRQISKLEL
jgi:hypothetical protein